MLPAGNELRGMICARYRSEAACAREIGWSKQRLNKITNGKKVPDVAELNCLAVALGCDAGDLLRFFLPA